MAGEIGPLQWVVLGENGFIESFNARLRDELLDGEIFYTLREAQIIFESWRRHYNTVRPHASIGYRAPAPEVFVPAIAAGRLATPTSSAGHGPPLLRSDATAPTQVRHENLKIDHPRQPFQCIARRRQPLQPLLAIKKSRLPRHR